MSRVCVNMVAWIALAGCGLSACGTGPSGTGGATPSGAGPSGISSGPSATAPVTEPQEPSRAGPHLPAPPSALRFACAADEDCVLDCELGAVSAVWRSTLAPRADCDDGCAGPDSGAPRCERARCVATHRDGSVMPECSGREVAFETAEPMLLVASARERMQTTSEARPHPYAFIALHNPTDQEQRVQLFATAVWVERSGGQAALPLAPERMSLRPPEDESPAAEETHASWLEFTSLPAGARREVVVQFAELPQSVPENRFPYRIRVTLRDSEGRMSAVDTQIRRGTRLPRR